MLHTVHRRVEARLQMTPLRGWTSIFVLVELLGTASLTTCERLELLLLCLSTSGDYRTTEWTRVD